MNYQGDFNAGQVVILWFNTFSSDDPAASVTITNFANTDVHIHKDDSLTQRNNAAGITVDVDVDAITGSHFIKIDTADNTVADFWVSGADYFVRIEGTTVDGGTINAFVGSFSIENRRVAGHMVGADIATLASQTSFTLSQGSADDDAYNNCTIIITDQVTAVQKAVGRISDYTGSTKTVTLAADPGIFTMAVGDNLNIIATSALANVDAYQAVLAVAGAIPAFAADGAGGLPVSDAGGLDLDTILDVAISTRLKPTVAGRNLDVTTGGAAGINWGNIENKTTSNLLSNTDTRLVATTTTNTDMRGTDSAATAAALAIVDTVVDAIKVVTDDQATAATTLVVSTTKAGTLSTTQASTNLTEATDDHYIGRTIIFSSGALTDQASDITDYVGVNGVLTFSALTEAPAAGVSFVIV